MAAFSTAAIIGTTAIGLGMQGYGMVQNQRGQAAYNAAQMQILEQERAAEAMRRRMMEIDARRRQLQSVRESQRARSLALSNAASQGAQYGSGVQGGFGQIAGQTTRNIQEINDALGFGQQMFGINEQISNARMQMGQAQTMMSQASGLSSLGGSIMSAGPTLGNIMAGWGSIPSYSSFGGGHSMNTIGGAMRGLGGSRSIGF